MNQEKKDKKINNLISLFTSGAIEDCKKETLKVLEIYPNEPFLFNLLGVTHAETNAFEDAITYYKKATVLNPEYFEVYNNMGVAYNHWKKPELAVESLRQAIKTNPNYAEAFNNLGNSQKELLDYEDAIKSYEKAIKIEPDYIDALCNLGIVLGVLERYLEAEGAFKKALTLEPSRKQTLYLYGSVLTKSKKLEEAKREFNSILIIDPDFAEAHNGLGLANFELKNFYEASENFRKAIDIKNDYLDAINNYGYTLQQNKQYEEAIKIFEKALRLDNLEEKDSFTLNNNLATIYLTLGKFKIGWTKYEYRWKISPGVTVTQPGSDTEIWDGQEDKKIVLWREQGIGDLIIFLSLVREASKVSKTLSVYIDPRLIPICERSMPGISFKKYTPGSFDGEVFDYHLPMGSLPRLFRNTEKDFERVIRGYLKPDCKRVELLRDELGLGGKKVIGISWKSIKSRNHLKKSLTLMDFKKIFKDLDVTLVNL